ncbi:MAG: glycosyltransferase family 2 protein [Anaerolineae bacterium]
MDKSLGVVIVSYNTRELLKKCLTSLEAELRRLAPKFSARTFVVDNASPDESAEMVRQDFPQMNLIANEENRGFAAANNQALRAMGFETETPGPLPDYVFLLNPDTIVEPGALEALLDFMEENPRAGVAGAGLAYPDGRFQHSAFAFPTLFQIFFDFFPINHRLINSRLNGRYPLEWYKSGQPFPIDHPLGAAFLVRGEAIGDAGIMDERFFMYCEEIDWCMRIKKAGWEIYCVPRARIVHYVAQSTFQLYDEMFVELWRSRYMLFEKHYSSLFRWLARRMVRMGVRREIAFTKQESAYTSQPVLEKHLAACQQVLEM